MVIPRILIEPTYFTSTARHFKDSPVRSNPSGVAQSQKYLKNIF